MQAYEIYLTILACVIHLRYLPGCNVEFNQWSIDMLFSIFKKKILVKLTLSHKC